VANTFLTRAEVNELFLHSAEGEVEKMPLEQVKEIAGFEGSFHPGLCSAIAVYMIIAARKRLTREAQCQE
jgi:hypothetical protein